MAMKSVQILVFIILIAINYLYSWKYINIKETIKEIRFCDKAINKSKIGKTDRYKVIKKVLTIQLLMIPVNILMIYSISVIIGYLLNLENVFFFIVLVILECLIGVLSKKSIRLLNYLINHIFEESTIDLELSKHNIELLIQSCKFLTIISLLSLCFVRFVP